MPVAAIGGTAGPDTRAGERMSTVAEAVQRARVPDSGHFGARGMPIWKW
jgi:hypothetical protein